MHKFKPLYEGYIKSMLLHLPQKKGKKGKKTKKQTFRFISALNVSILTLYSTDSHFERTSKGYLIEVFLALEVVRVYVQHLRCRQSVLSLSTYVHPFASTTAFFLSLLTENLYMLRWLGDVVVVGDAEDFAETSHL